MNESCLGHLARIGKKREAYKFLWNSEGKRLLRRPSHRYEFIFKWKGVDLVNLVQDWNEGWAVVKKEMSIRVQDKGNFLTSRRYILLRGVIYNVSFSCPALSLLHGIVFQKTDKLQRMQQLRFLFAMALLYMFRVTISPIIRSTMLYMATGELAHLGCY